MSPMSDHQPQEQQDGDATRAVSSPHLPLSQQPLFTSPGTRRLIIPTATLLSEEEGATATATATATGATSVSRASQGGAATPAESILDGEEENHGGCFGPSLMQATSPTASSAAGPVAGLQQPHPLGDSRTLWPGAPAATLPRPLPRSSMGLSWASAFKLPTEWAQAHASRCSDTSTEVVPYTDDALPTQVCCNKLCFCDGCYQVLTCRAVLLCSATCMLPARASANQAATTRFHDLHCCHGQTVAVLGGYIQTSKLHRQDQAGEALSRSLSNQPAAGATADEDIADAIAAHADSQAAQFTHKSHPSCSCS